MVNFILCSKCFSAWKVLTLYLYKFAFLRIMLFNLAISNDGVTAIEAVELQIIKICLIEFVYFPWFIIGLTTSCNTVIIELESTLMTDNVLALWTLNWINDNMIAAFAYEIIAIWKINAQIF